MTKQKSKNRKRTLSRLIAVQIFYQHDFGLSEKSYDEIKKHLVENYILNSDDEISSYQSEIDSQFLDKLILAPQLFEKIDQDIAPFINQPVSKLDKIVLHILRLAIFELQTLKDIPPNVVIDEYVGIAASFFDHKKVTFVNAILDKFK
ncbi:MAG: transcription antitermination factor NusB [Proteobacteria bacterium]|nr:transcription antitermination factor NusB [Pseudomonadota bacterium]